MLFDIEYVVVLIIVLIGAAIFKNQRIALLLLASYAFYFNISGYYILCLILITLLTFYCGRQIVQHPQKKHLYLYATVLGAIGQLSLFKFGGGSIPIGLSFYTFLSINYVFDIYRGKLEPVTIKDYALFVSFFPIVTSGPIARAREFLPQLNTATLRSEDLRYGVTLIALGLIKKFAIADNIGGRIDFIFSQPYSYGSTTIILATLAFGLQLYLDFSGYSDIAIGSARILGFKIPPNFNNPYLAANPSEFWRRWNISLSTFLKDYLYIPLGGNRKGDTRTYTNLIITMALCGLWHGATWNFILWGAYHGCLLSTHRLIGNSLGNRFASKLWTVPKVVITQYFIFLGWLFFRISDLDKLMYCLGKFLTFDVTALARLFPLIPIALLAILFKDKIVSTDWTTQISLLDLKYWFLYLVAAIMLVVLLAPSTHPDFIYQAF